MKNELFYRSFEIDSRALDEEKREIPVSFSSEKEVERWFGIEILSHNEGAVSLARIKKVGAHLFNHNPSQIIGPVKNVEIKDGRGLAVLGYDETDEGETRLIQTKNKSLKGTSAGYRVFEFKELAPGEEYKLATKVVRGKKDKVVMIATKWEIVDISSTPVPIDIGVGIGRCQTRSLDGINIERSQNHNKEDNTMKSEEVQEMIDKAIGKIEIPKAEDIATAVRSILTEDAKPKMKIDNEVFIDILGRAGAVSPECKIKITDMATEGKTEAELLRTITDMATEDSDANDKGNLDKGTGLVKDPKNVQRAVITSFDQITDEEFFAGLARPSLAF